MLCVFSLWHHFRVLVRSTAILCSRLDLSGRVFRFTTLCQHFRRALTSKRCLVPFLSSRFCHVSSFFTCLAWATTQLPSLKEKRCQASQRNCPRQEPFGQVCSLTIFSSVVFLLYYAILYQRSSSFCEVNAYIFFQHLPLMAKRSFASPFLL